MAATAPDRRPLVERIRPSGLSELIGNPHAVSELRKWADSWDRPTGFPGRRSAILEGPPGVGKTTAAHALALEHGWTVVEMNASDARNQSALEAVAGRASVTNTLGSFGTYRGTRKGGRTLILLDEADSLSGRSTEARPRSPSTVSFRDFLRGRYATVEALAAAWGLGRPGAPRAFDSWDEVPATSGRGAWTKLAAAQRDVADWKGGQVVRDESDRGGLGTIARLVRETRQPLILTVNDPEPLRRYSPIFRTHAVHIRFERPRPTELKSLLRRVAVREGFALPVSVIDRVVERSEGDVRAALNDLEAIAPLPPGTDLSALLGGRDAPSDYFQVVEDVLTHPRFYHSVEISNRLDATPDDLLPYFEEALVRWPASATTRIEAFERLARADQFLFRARRQRVFSLWSYATETLAGGLSLDLADGSPAPRWIPTGFPQFIGAMGRTRALRAVRQSLLTKAGRHYHESRRKAWEFTLPFLDRLLRRPTGRAPEPPSLAGLRRAAVRSLELTAEELGALTGLDPTDPTLAAMLAPEESGGDAPPEESGADAPVQPESATDRSRPTAPPSKKKVQRRLAEF
ncbi:MAG TPA: AAA family ATPase [Thermoplasmata archaeon]|nr:AAA family ATPase [Thermoplasmata archaeon]